MKTNSAEFNGKLDLWLQRLSFLATEDYKKIIWEMFLSIVRETPQYTGKAVANWNISVGSPDFTVYVQQADVIPSGPTYSSHWSDPRDLAPARQRGDTTWERVAWNRNRPKMKAIQYRDKVFISNGVTGENDFPYLQAYQSEPWISRLRVVNQPYVTMQESVIIVATKWLKRGYVLPTTGGDAWESA